MSEMYMKISGMSLFTSIILLLLVFSCSSNKNLVNVTHLKDVKNYKENAMIYSLTKTVIMVDVEVVKTITYRGPFYAQAERLLGLKNVARNNKIEWSIVNINFKTYPVVDTTQFYLVESLGKNSSYAMNFTRQGFLAGVNLKTKTVNNVQTEMDKLFASLPQITSESLATDNSTIEIMDSIEFFKNADTVFANVPVLKRQFDLRTSEEQAFEVARQIFQLRDDKNALIVGDTKNSPEAGALKFTLSEIKRIENNYLSLFKGKTIKESHHFVFEFTPGDYKPVMQKILFRFTPATGILSSKNVKGNPFILELSSDGQLNSIKKFQNEQEWYKRSNKIKNNSGLFYRIPENVVVKLLNGKEILAQKQISVAQYGTISTLPIDLIIDNASVEFYPETSAIKSINK